MRFLIVTWTAVLLLAGPANGAAGSCCGDHQASGNAACCAGQACCKSRECCEGKEPCCAHDPALAAIDAAKLPQVTPHIEWPEETARPNRELAKVLFRHPVRIGDRVLFGPYVIEHDAERMARGLPCTHIYAADDLQLPVVAFHCRHLERKPTTTATITLQRIASSTTPMYKLVEYQFENSGEGHGVPDGR